MDTITCRMLLWEYQIIKLFEILIFGQLHIVQWLIEEEFADVDAQNENGWHSLFFSIFGGHLEVIDYLLFETSSISHLYNEKLIESVNIELRDNQRRSSEDLATEMSDQTILELFSEYRDQSLYSFAGSALQLDDEEEEKEQIDQSSIARETFKEPFQNSIISEGINDFLINEESLSLIKSTILEQNKGLDKI